MTGAFSESMLTSLREAQRHAVGATVYSPMPAAAGLAPLFEAEGWRPRPAPHAPLGFTLSFPTSTVAAIGAAYRVDGQVKEDIVTVDLASGAHKHWSKGAFQREDPRYANTHHGGQGHLQASMPSAMPVAPGSPWVSEFLFVP